MNTTAAPAQLPYLTRAELDALNFKYASTTAARMARRGPFEPCTITAEALFASLPADGSPEARWEGFGHVTGVERFGKTIMRRSSRGVEVLRSDNGTVLLVHPLGAGRTIRTFRQAR